MNAHNPTPLKGKPLDLQAQNETTRMAHEDTLLQPRFYTTDFDKLDAMDVSLVREEWDALIASMASDPNKGHFKRNEEWDDINLDDVPEELRAELVDFLVSSLTAEFSGCVLYKEMQRRGTNEDIKALFTYMSRDEARHAGFINDSLKDFGIGVNLGFLTKAKKYTFFQPKFIFYATYLSEKIGYARYITIFRHFEKHPEKRFRVRDHARPEFHKAAGLDIEEYDMRVFEITNACTTQCFPLVLDIDNPAFLRTLRRLNEVAVKIGDADQQGGIAGALKKKALQAVAAASFVRLYLIPTKKNEIPEVSKMVPAW